MEIDSLAGRLMIEKVVLKNFKSYAGEKVIGPFHKSLTSVVGPNGSGKSNLLESLLFAFGKRARKMRLKKLSELIHHSHTHPNLTEASVEVHFMNIIDTETSYEPVVGSTLVLTRVVRKNNTSEYRLDGRTSSYEEVTNTLKRRGIDLEQNRFLILQGEVEQIAMMKPKAPPGEDSKSGLLEYLEEIIGTDKYVNDIEAAEKLLEGIGDEVSSKKLKFEEAKKVMDQLEAPMKEAVAYIELEKEGFCFKNLKMKVEKHMKAKNAENVMEDIKRQDRKLAELEEQFNQKKKENEVAINEYQKKADELQRVQKTKLKLEREMAEILAEDAKIIEGLKAAKNSVVQTEADCKGNAKRCEEIQKIAQDITEDIPRLEGKLEEIRVKRAEKQQEYDKKTEETIRITDGLQKRKAALEENVAPFKRDLDKSKNQRDAKKKEVDMLTEELNNGDKEKETIGEALIELKEKIITKEQEFQFAEDQLAEVTAMHANYVNELENIERTIDEASKVVRNANQKIAAYEREEKKTFNTKSQIGEILKAKMQRTLDGVHGRLGDLGTINSVYDYAVSSAFPNLDHFLVDSVAQGNRLIDFVRERALGKVNIIVLDKLENKEHDMNTFHCPDPKAVRLFDQIRFSDDKFRKAFYFVFGNSLFTETLDDARRIAFGAKRFKVITKDGDIINPSGEMRGFSNPLKGKMKLDGSFQNVHVEDIQAARLSLQRANEDLTKLQKQRTEIVVEITKVKGAEREFKYKTNKLRAELELLNQSAQQSNDRLRILNSRSNVEINEEILKLTTVIDKVSDLIKKYELLVGTNLKEIAEIEASIDQVAGNEYKMLKKEVKTLEEEDEKLDKDINKCRSKLNQQNKDLEKYKKQQNLAEAELKRLQDIIAGLKARKAELLAVGNEKATQLSQINEFEAEESAQIEELERQKLMISKEFESILSQREEIKEKKKELHSNLKEINNEIQRWQTKLDHTVADFTALVQEYSELLQGMEIDPTATVSDHINKRNRLSEERVQLIRPINWAATEDELQELTTKLSVLENIENIIESELSANQPNLKVIQDYKVKQTDKVEKEQIFNDIKSQENELKATYTDLKSKRFNEFTKGFREISEKLREMYNLLTRGGNAELEFADSTDPFAEGIVFTVRPPLKSWKKMANLSGGEKTLSSLALVFALHHYKPNSLYVMDEVDAALDFQNVSVIANYIKGETKNAQFIVVSLRYQMFEVADQLVGIYKTKDVSHSISVSPYSLKDANSENPIIKQTIDNISLKNN